MLHKEKDVPIVGTITLLLVILNVIILKTAFIRDSSWYSALVITLPMLVLALMNMNSWPAETAKGLKHD